MKRRRPGIRQLTALLVLTIVTAASGLPHWHTAPLDGASRTDIHLRTDDTAAFLATASDVDLLECAACVLQRILTHARTRGTEAPPLPCLQTDVEKTSEQLISTSPHRYADPRGPPRS